ncbi:MAG TPA: DUF6114 domain-containing protein [Actinocrinis sp.]|uniref:DUF6114 domain-containing protein n=1 Tax=Actinocrinis sp. TaxID=1920516 RepID=UPI002D573151|nr:DUF6114 domain-containing protein [Actinocrinis sp.]HZU55489.1 DUF6114 domain-containing protein [Actinocrinis sp.]
MTTHTLDSPTPREPSRPAVVRALHAFRQWRKGRPFPAGLLIVLAGIELWLAPLSSIGNIIHEGVGGVSAFFIGALMIMFGLTIWFAPAYRVFAGIASILLGLIALPATNLGGFFIGTLLSLIGGGLAVAWTPRPGWEAPTRRERRRQQRIEEQPTEPGEGESYQAGSYEPGMYENVADPAATQAHGAAATGDAELAEFEARSRAGADAPTINLPEVEERGADQHPEA